MGKGIIKGGGSGGQYSLEVVLDTSRIQAEITRLTGRIAQVRSMMAGMEDGKRKSYYRLLLTSLEKKISYLENHRPENPVLSAWCADLTENLSGDVGTIEIPGERGTVLIRPGHNGGASYSRGRDGILVPVSAISPAEAFYNLAMKPGWQKWMPTYRFGTITSIDGDICSVSLEGAENSDTGLGINQTASLSGVPISYMECNGSAFAEGDKVVVEFQGRDWSNPRVIGFKDNPKPCCAIYETFAGNQFKYGEWSVVANWDEENNPSYYFSDEVLHFSLNNDETVQIIFPGTGIIKNNPILRWNIDCNDAGWSCDHGIARVWVRITVGTVVHTFVVYMNPHGLANYYPSSPPGFTAETVGKGVIEIDLRERFSEDEVFSNIYIDLSNQDTDYDLLIGIIGFFTLCPK